MKRVTGVGGMLRLNMKGRVRSGERAISKGKITFLRALSRMKLGVWEGFEWLNHSLFYLYYYSLHSCHRVARCEPLTNK